MLNKPPLKRGETLPESVQALALLPNELIHFKAGWMHDPKAHAKVSKVLASK